MYWLRITESKRSAVILGLEFPGYVVTPTQLFALYEAFQYRGSYGFPQRGPEQVIVMNTQGIEGP